jgi:hypothetical protein
LNFIASCHDEMPVNQEIRLKSLFCARWSNHCYAISSLEQEWQRPRNTGTALLRNATTMLQSDNPSIHSINDAAGAVTRFSTAAQPLDPPFPCHARTACTPAKRRGEHPQIWGWRLEVRAHRLQFAVQIWIQRAAANVSRAMGCVSR